MKKEDSFAGVLFKRLLAFADRGSARVPLFLREVEEALDEMERTEKEEDRLSPVQLPVSKKVPAVDEIWETFYQAVTSARPIGGEVTLLAERLRGVFPRNQRPKDLVSFKRSLEVGPARKAVADLYRAVLRMQGDSCSEGRDVFSPVLRAVSRLGKMLRVFECSEDVLYEMRSTRREIRCWISGSSQDVAAAAAAVREAVELTLAKQMVALADQHGWSVKVGGYGGVTFEVSQPVPRKSYVHFEHVDWPAVLKAASSQRAKKERRAASGGATSLPADSASSRGRDEQDWSGLDLPGFETEEQEGVDPGHMRSLEALGIEPDISERGEALLNSLGYMGAALADEQDQA